MSNNSSTQDKWGPSKFVLGDAAFSQAMPKKGRRVSPVRGRFIAGPVDVAWLSKARKLGVTALWVGLALWHLRGLKRSDSFIVSNLIMQEWGVQADAKGRALRALEKAGLIIVERTGRHSPRVTLVVRRPINDRAVE